MAGISESTTYSMTSVASMGSSIDAALKALPLASPKYKCERCEDSG